MKDFSKLEEYIRENGSVKTSNALEMGYSNYDLKVFMNEALIEKIARGQYTLVKKEEKVVEAPPMDYREMKNKNYEAVGCIMRKEYDRAVEIYTELASSYPQNGYYTFALSYISFLKEEYEKAYEYLKVSSSKNVSDNANMVNYAVALMLNRYVTIPENDLVELESKVSDEVKKSKFFSKVCSKIIAGNYAVAQKNLYYFLQGDIKGHRFTMGNQYLYNVLIDLMDKLGIEIIGKKKEETSVVVPEVSQEQVLMSTIILNALDDEDYDKAVQLVDSYDLVDSKNLICDLINRIRVAKSKGVSSLTSSKVVSTEEVVVYSANSVIEEVNKSSIQDTPKVVFTPKEDVVLKSKPEEVVTAEQKYMMYKEAMENCDFVAAKSYLFQYDRLLKKDGKYRNIQYHVDRVASSKKEYEENPQEFLIKRERIGTASSLVNEKKYDEALRVLDEIPQTESVLLFKARIYSLIGEYDRAYELVKGLEDCKEPNYYRVMAYIAFDRKKYEEALSYCFKYNECRPQQTPTIYVLMADCYEKLRKPSKAIKVLRIVEKINKERGINKDYSSRMSYNEKNAESRRLKRLALARNESVE